jgi:succinate dehydrogenase / fumarate reductase cytochrome b subunit
LEKALALHKTTVGKKAIMAISGLMLVGFIVMHMLGNLNVYLGPQAMWDYAKGLRQIPGLLWVARLGLLGAIGAHIWSAYQLTQLNESARPVAYERTKSQTTTFAARTMYMSGLIMLCYIVFHIGHLTLGIAPHEFKPYNVYNNFVYGFQIWWISLFYIVGNCAVGIHLYHGFWSLFQSLGVNHPRYNHYRKLAATGLAFVVTAVNLSFPISVILGFLEPTTMTFQPW